MFHFHQANVRSSKSTRSPNAIVQCVSAALLDRYCLVPHLSMQDKVRDKVSIFQSRTGDPSLKVFKQMEANEFLAVQVKVFDYSWAPVNGSKAARRRPRYPK